MELPLDYVRCSPLTGPESTVPRYLTALLDDGRVIYGWVDGFEPVAEKGPGNNTRVLWHVDWWMQYQHWKRAGTPYTRLTHGRIKRGPAADARPEPSEPRFWEYSYNYILNPNQGPYAVALFTRTVNNITELRL